MTFAHAVIKYGKDIEKPYKLRFMRNLAESKDALDTVEQPIPSIFQATWLKKLRGGILFAIGYLLSPLSWWNDLFFNLPVAYAFGYLCSLIFPNFLLQFTIAGYWLSNIAGIILMQLGVLDVFQGEQKDRNLKKELLMGVVSSTVYTLIILALVQLKILDAPALFSGENPIDVGAFLSFLKGH